MDTKTRKDEALSLLEKIDPADRDYLGQNKFCFHLNLWTAERAGYTIKDAIGGWEVAEPDDDRFEFVSFLTDAIPSYATSIDACMMLPKPPGYFWELVSPIEGDTSDSAGANLIDHVDIEQEWQHYAKTLPLAILKCWWALQE